MVPLPAGVAPDARAVAISVTVTDPTAPVYVTVHPNGVARPTSSVVNSDPLERARAVTVLAPVTPAGLVVYPIGAGERDRRRDRVVHRPERCAVDRWVVRRPDTGPRLGLARHG